MDAGPKSLEIFKEVILNSKTILWNGPVGVFEFSNYSNGTKSVGDAVARSTENGAFSLVGVEIQLQQSKSLIFKTALAMFLLGVVQCLKVLKEKNYQA